MLNKIKYLLPAGLLTYIYYPTFIWMSERWWAADSYYAHGIFIPILAVYWLWKKREKLASMQKDSESWFLFPLVAAVLLQIFSSILRVYFLSAFSFVFLLAAAVGFVFGRKMLLEIWFPLFFLTLMIPLPLLAISQITLMMKFFVSEIATYWINAAGIKAIREGSYIYTNHSVLLVGDPCSGLRSFLAFLCLGLVVAYQSKVVLWKRLFIAALGLPLAILSNILRVFFMGLVGEIYGVEYTKGFIHDASGVVVFLIALFFFLMAKSRLESANVKVNQI